MLFLTDCDILKSKRSEEREQSQTVHSTAPASRFNRGRETKRGEWDARADYRAI